MQRRPYKTAKSGLICTNPNCNNISSKLFIVEEKIINALRDWLKEYKIDVDLEKICQENKVKSKQVLSNLQKQLEMQKTKIVKVYDYFENGIYTEETFIERIAILNAKKNEIEQYIKNQRRAINEEKTSIPNVENIVDIYYTLESAEEKNLFLKAILKKVVYKKDYKAIGKNEDLTDFAIDIYPNV